MTRGRIACGRPIDASQSLVLLKPLARNAGGVAHEGGDLWPSTDDPPCVCLASWLAGEVGLSAAQACDEAAAALDPYAANTPSRSSIRELLRASFGSRSAIARSIGAATLCAPHGTNAHVGDTSFQITRRAKCN